MRCRGDTSATSFFKHDQDCDYLTIRCHITLNCKTSSSFIQGSGTLRFPYGCSVTATFEEQNTNFRIHLTANGIRMTSCFEGRERKMRTSYASFPCVTRFPEIITDRSSHREGRLRLRGVLNVGQSALLHAANGCCCGAIPTITSIPYTIGASFFLCRIGSGVL